MLFAYDVAPGCFSYFSFTFANVLLEVHVVALWALTQTQANMVVKVGEGEVNPATISRGNTPPLRQGKGLKEDNP